MFCIGTPPFRSYETVRHGNPLLIVPLMNTKIRWGILGTGRIAKKFAEGLALLPDAELAAVGSRTTSAAESFSKEYRASRAHESYEGLAADPEVDAIYIATPHSLHAASTLLCLAAGKAVLCEKPFAINAREAQGVIAEARKRRLLVMEAMWTRFLPSIVRLREILRSGRIGEVSAFGGANAAGACLTPPSAAAHSSTSAFTRSRSAR
jgi:predicted dehydrogenase